MAGITSPTRNTYLEIQAGDDHPLVFDVLVNKVPQDCTGWTAKAQVRDRHGDLLHAWSTLDGSAVCDVAGVTLLLDDSDAWEWTHGYFDIRATSPTGIRVVTDAGPVKVKPLRTR